MPGRSDLERQERARRDHPRQPLPGAGVDANARPMSARHVREILEAIDELALDVRSLRKFVEKRMAKLDDDLDAIFAKVEATETKIGSAIALLEALKAKVDAIVGGSITPAQQAKLDAIFAGVSDDPDKLQAAIDANTPAEDPVDPEEPVEE